MGEKNRRKMGEKVKIFSILVFQNAPCRLWAGIAANEPCVVAVQLFDKLEQLKNMETKEEKRENLVEFLFENSACLNCIAVYYCGSFISKDDCLKCIDDGLQELLQHNVSNSFYYGKST